MSGSYKAKIMNVLYKADNKVFYLSYVVGILLGSTILPGNFFFLFIPAVIILTPIICYLGIELTKQEVKNE